MFYNVWSAFNNYIADTESTKLLDWALVDILVVNFFIFYLLNKFDSFLFEYIL
jgi:hypothetical protein